MKFAKESGKESGSEKHVRKDGALYGRGNVVFGYMECGTKDIGKCRGIHGECVYPILLHFHGSSRKRKIYGT